MDVTRELAIWHHLEELFGYLDARFHTRPGRTAWWVNASASRQLLEAGLPRSHLHESLEAARAALLDESRRG